MGKTIIINQDSCKKCMTCVEVCPNKIFKKDEAGLIITRPDRIDLCFICGHCMAVCSTRSIVVEGMSYDSDFFDLLKVTSVEEPFFNLIYTRRAIRNFKDMPVPKSLLERITEAISYAPPGFPPLKYKLVVVQNTYLIRESLPYMINLYEKLVKIFKKPFYRFFIKKEVGKQKFITMQNHLIPLIKSRLPELNKGTEDTITRNAPAMILFLSDCKKEDIRQDIYIAATYGMLAAHAIGLGGSIMDLIPPAIEKDKELRKKFHIPDNHNVITSLILGYPKYKFARGIKRNLKSVEWL